jgi:hypothetical protein
MASPKKSELKELYAYIEEKFGRDAYRASTPAKDLVDAWKAGGTSLTLEQMKDKVDAAMTGKNVSSAGKAIRMTDTTVKGLKREASKILGRDAKSATGKSVSLSDAMGSTAVSGSGEEINRLAMIENEGGTQKGSQ